MVEPLGTVHKFIQNFIGIGAGIVCVNINQNRYAQQAGRFRRGLLKALIELVIVGQYLYLCVYMHMTRPTE